MNNIKKCNVPLCRPSIENHEIETIIETIKSGWLAHGEYNKKFEKLFADYLKVPHAITMNSCTSALEVALKVNNIKGEVIIPSMTFVATANAVVTSGATPVFCDVDGPTRNVTADIIQHHITSQTEAVIIVHFGGQPCQMDDIVNLCDQHNLLLIEDSAETLGATWRGKQAGSFGIGCFSFFPTKNITTAEGGMLTCHDTSIAEKARVLISHGISSTTASREKSRQPWLREAIIPGHNYRMPNPLAALGYHQIKRIDALNDKRINIAHRYNAELKDLSPILKTPEVIQEATHVYQMYTIEIKFPHRDEVLDYLRKNDIGASVHFSPPVHLQSYYYENFGKKLSFPVTERLANELITLPMFPDMTKTEQDWVIHCIRESVKGL